MMVSIKVLLSYCNYQKILIFIKGNSLMKFSHKNLQTLTEVELMFSLAVYYSSSITTSKACTLRWQTRAIMLYIGIRCLSVTLVKMSTNGDSLLLKVLSRFFETKRGFNGSNCRNQTKQNIGILQEMFHSLQDLFLFLPEGACKLNLSISKTRKEKN